MKEFLFSQLYRPTTISDCILPEDVKALFLSYKKNGIPNLLFTGKSGRGKTTVAKCLLTDTTDYIMINGSLDRNIDVLRNKIQQFASTVSLNGRKKAVFIDEADYLNALSTQPAMRRFIEEFSKNCVFIFTCNHQVKLIPELISRMSVIDFDTFFTKKNMPELATQFTSRIEYIMKEENVVYDKKNILKYVSNYYPDFRKVLNELQKYIVDGELKSFENSIESNVNMTGLIEAVSKKDFDETRKLIGTSSFDSSNFYKELYLQLSPKLKGSVISNLILILADYSYKDSFVADKEINMTACCVEIMRDCF